MSVSTNEYGLSIKSLCIRNSGLSAIAKEHFDGDISKLLLVGPVNSITITAGNSSAWTELYTNIPPLSRSTRSIVMRLETRETSRSILDRVDIMYSYPGPTPNSMVSMKLNYYYPPSRSSIDNAVRNVSLELASNSNSDLFNHLRIICEKEPALFDAGIRMGNSNILMVNSYMSTGATGAVAPNRVAKFLRNNITDSDVRRVAGFNILQISPLGGNVTDKERIKRYEYMRNEIFAPYITNNTNIPLILIPYRMDESSESPYATNEDIVRIIRLIEAIASAPDTGIAGDIPDIMSSSIYIPTRVISGEIIKREGVDVAQNELLTGDLIKENDSIIAWDRVIVLAYASSPHDAEAINSNIRRQIKSDKLSTNSIVLRYDRDQRESRSYLVMLFPVKRERYSELFNRIKNKL